MARHEYIDRDETSRGWRLLTKSIAKSVDIATSIPRLFRTYALSSEASAELVPQTEIA